MPRLKSSRKQKLIVRLVLHHVPHRLERVAVGERFQVRLHVLHQRHPADDALHERVLGRQFAQPARLRERLPGLHADHAVDADRFDLAAANRAARSRAAAPPSNRRSSRTRRDCNSKNDDERRFA